VLEALAEGLLVRLPRAGGAGDLDEGAAGRPRHVSEVEHWPLELYNLAGISLAPPETELAWRVALLTGVASGIERAVVRCPDSY
jgi:hypothetical protein